MTSDAFVMVIFDLSLGAQISHHVFQYYCVMSPYVNTWEEGDKLTCKSIVGYYFLIKTQNPYESDNKYHSMICYKHISVLTHTINKFNINIWYSSIINSAICNFNWLNEVFFLSLIYLWALCNGSLIQSAIMKFTSLFLMWQYRLCCKFPPNRLKPSLIWWYQYAVSVSHYHL